MIKYFEDYCWNVLVKKKCFLLSVIYDGESKRAILKFLDEDAQRIVRIPDVTGHKPYCFSKLPKNELLVNEELVSLPGFETINEEIAFDALHDQNLNLSKIVVSDPLSISGKPSGTVKSVLHKVWEADIPYVLNYTYDTDLIPGTYYLVDFDSFTISILPPYKLTNLQDKMFDDLINKIHFSQREVVKKLAILLEMPIPEIKRVALDIEVLPETINRIPDAEIANMPIVAVSFVDSEGHKKIFLLIRDDLQKISYESLSKSKNVSITDFKDEKNLISASFEEITKYPMIITFNGDNFDLPYLRNRARNLGILDQDIPIKIGRNYSDIVTSTHVDLYRFFFNKSIQNYAFSGSYKEATLNAIGNAILGKNKLSIGKSINELGYSELAEYCLTDAEITLGLTTYGDSIVIKLICTLMRVSKCPIEEIVRHAVSSWIRSLFLALHRQNGLLIPNPEDIAEAKGVTFSKAIIKGKKYMGGIVLEPTQGVHFNVVVMDFASLYPSVIDKFNLSYETVRCPHQECKKNLVPDLPHWVCTKKKGMTSSVIGNLRTLRVMVFVPLSKTNEIQKEERRKYDVIQKALKVFLNASYGVMGAESFQFYTPPLAESVTAIARKLLTEVISKAQSFGVQVIYGDTDSVFLKNPKEETIKELSIWIKESYGIDLNLDKKYKYVVFSQRKKNYFGVTEENIVDVKGLIGKKSSTPEFAKKVFFDVLRILSDVSNEDEFNVAKEKVSKIITENVQRIKQRDIMIEELSFNIMLSKDLNSYDKTTPQHVKAAKELVAYGYEYKPGDIVSYVKIKAKAGVKPTKLASINEIDIDKYIEIFNSVFEQIADPLGIDILGNNVKGARILDFM